MSRPDVSVIIVTYRSAEHIRACVEALPAAAAGRAGGHPAVTYEAIVIDNASPDDTVDVAGTLADVRLLALPSNAGFAGGVNAGLQAATGEFVVLLNPDALMHESALTSAVAYARAYPARRLYGARTYDTQGKTDLRSAFGLPSLWSTFCFATGLSTALRGSGRFNPEGLGSWQRDDTREVGALSGCCLLARRDFLVELGGLDTTFFMYSEDIDLAVRARRRGAHPVIVQDARVTHIGGASSSTADKTVMVMRGRVSYMRKHWGRAACAVGRLLLIVGVAARSAGARVTGQGRKWQEVQARRSEWQAGWGAGQS